MARARNIKPSFFTNDILAECEIAARLLFTGLWTISDREGRLEDRPLRIKAQILPYDNFDCDKLLNQLSERGFVIRYEKENNKYIQIVNFSKHQNPHIKEAVSIIPIPDKHRANTIRATPITDSLLPITDSLLPITDSLLPITDSLLPINMSAKKPTGVYSEAFLLFWQLYPRKDGSKKEAFKSYLTAIKGVTHERIIEAVSAYAGYLRENDIEQSKIAHATTWLNQARWESDYRAAGSDNHTGSGHDARSYTKNFRRNDGERLAKWEIAGARVVEKIERGEI